MSNRQEIPRRTFLRGLGTAMALPLLDSVLPVRAFGSSSAAAKPPTRMAFLFVPNGAHLPDWTPRTVGADFDLPPILQPLAPLKEDLLVLSGLTHDKGRANGDGPGDHARSAAVFLTGVQPLKAEGAIRAGISADQLAARVAGKQTRFPSLQLGIEPGRQSGQCDSGYSCAYSNNISWRDESTPMAKETNPRLVFERLFASELQKDVVENQGKRAAYKKSILDFVLEDAKQLQAKVGGHDRQKLDEYLTSVREIELRLERAERAQRIGELQGFDAIAEYGKEIGDAPDSFEDHARLIGDMLVLAFQTDVTRVATFMLANEGSNRAYRPIGVNEGHHTLSHHQNDPEKLAKISRINQFHARQLAYVLGRLKSIKEGEGTLLDNCMIVYGAGISDGNRHNNENLPILMAGKAGGTILPGRHVAFSQETPMCNLLLSMLDRMGVHEPYFGDSTGRLPWLEG